MLCARARASKRYLRGAHRASVPPFHFCSPPVFVRRRRAAAAVTTNFRFSDFGFFRYPSPVFQESGLFPRSTTTAAARRRPQLSLFNIIRAYLHNGKLTLRLVWQYAAVCPVPVIIYYYKGLLLLLSLFLWWFSLFAYVVLIVFRFPEDRYYNILYITYTYVYHVCMCVLARAHPAAVCTAPVPNTYIVSIVVYIVSSRVRQSFELL